MPTPSSQPSPNFDFAEPSNRTPPVPDAFKASPPGDLSRIQQPPPTRIYPQPINPPPGVASTAPPAPASTPATSSRLASRTGGRIAGSFKMPLGSGAAARGGASIVGRRIPYVALAFLAYDAYQLACSLQLIPGSICPRPDNPNPGGESQDFKGGQCCDHYYYVFSQTFSDNSGWSAVTRRPETLGTIIGVVFSTNTNGTLTYSIRSRRCNGFITDENQISGMPGTINLRITKVEPSRGQPDNCGDPQPIPQPKRMPDQINNIINFNRNINLNFNVPNPAPPSPRPKPVPRTISPPSPLPDININFGDNYFGGGDTDYDFDIDFNFSPAPKGNFNDYPDIFNNFPPSPQPQTKDPDPFPKDNPPPQPAPQPKPLPELPPPLPDKLPENSTDEDRYIYRQNKETLDKVYKANAEILEIQTEQLKQRKILENIQSLLDFEIEGSQLIKRCDDVEVFYSYKDKVLKAISKQIQHVQAIEQTIINEVCEVEKESVVASPDWWQVRLRADVPQISLIFRAMGTRTYHKLNLPHPLNVNKLTAPPIPTYKKGNWQGEIVCVDNSKFLVNCESKIEAERIVNIALLFIDPAFIGLTPRLYFAERKGVTVSTGGMLATSALYFSKGQQNTMPDWRVAFKYL